MPVITVRDSEAIELALRRFKRSCERAGILPELRRRQYYEKPAEVRRRKALMAIRRQRKKVFRSRRRLSRPF